MVSLLASIIIVLSVVIMFLLENRKEQERIVDLYKKRYLQKLAKDKANSNKSL